MLESTPFWTHGSMNLWLNNKPARVYVPKKNVKTTYETLKSRLSKDGQIPIGIDHLADNIIESNGVLKKLDLLNVGHITDIEYADDTIKIVEAEFTNPLIQKLYENGELDMVSIVASSTTSECPRGDYDYIIDTTDITRVDIVEKGACKSCNIPKPQSSSDNVVYARYSIIKLEENTMAEDALTADVVKNLIAEAIKPITDRLDKLENKKTQARESHKEGEEESEEMKKMKAEMASLKLEAATAQVDKLIYEGKMLPSMKESAVKLAATDAVSFEEMYKDAPVIVELDHKRSLNAGNSGDEGEGETDDEKLIATVNAAFDKD